MPGLALGAWLLAVAPQQTLRVVISALIILFLALILMRVRRTGPKTTQGLAASGILSGVANGASGVGGPSIVLYYLTGDDSSAALRATVICYFFIIDAASAGIYAGQGFVTERVLALSVLCIPAAVVGVWIGSRLFDKASEQTYRRVAYGIIAAAALLGPFV